MNNMLFQAICRTGIFMICAQAIVQFRPHESYEKYLKLLVSVMVLIQLFLPIARLFAGSGSMEADELLASFRENLEQEMEEAKRRTKEADALLQQMTLEEVRRRMEEMAAASGKEEEIKGAAEEGEEETAEGGDEKEAVEGEDAKDTAKKEGEETVSGAGKESAKGQVTVEVEPVAPILGGQTGGLQ